MESVCTETQAYLYEKLDNTIWKKFYHHSMATNVITTMILKSSSQHYHLFTEVINTEQGTH